MKVLYIGHYNQGSTSRMRGEYLGEILNPIFFKVINIDIPMKDTNRLFRSIGWRYKIGPLINNINKFVLNEIMHDWIYDIVWIDKGVFIKPDNIKKLKTRNNKVIHFTPDPAFTYHQSSLFQAAIPFYDFCVTTKSFEVDEYIKFKCRNVIYCTQGFDSRVHRPYHFFAQKSIDVSFVGHFEMERANLIQTLIDNGIEVVLAGIKWQKFVAKNKNNSNLNYLGNGIFGIEYAKLISSSFFSLGLISNWVPEKHTTRTFEIPACGTCLISPSNDEIRSFYSDDEVLFYESTEEIPNMIHRHLQDKKKLQQITDAGSLRVHQGNYEYKKILYSLILKILD
jgi:spore maturation protein CgeB